MRINVEPLLLYCKHVDCNYMNDNYMQFLKHLEQHVDEIEGEFNLKLSTLFMIFKLELPNHSGRILCISYSGSL